MTTLAEFPYAEVYFDRCGVVEEPVQVRAAQAPPSGVDDLLVQMHGWNNTPAVALAHYLKNLGHPRTLMDGVLSQQFGARSLGGLGIVWPSLPEALLTPTDDASPST